MVCICLVFIAVVITPAPVLAADAIKLRLSNALAPGTFQNKVLLPAFAKSVKDKTGGRVTVELYPGGQLFGPRGNGRGTGTGRESRWDLIP